MTQSAPNPLVSAAIPTAIAVLVAAKQFLANLGNDPLQIPVKAPGALEILIGQVELQFPALAGAEFGAVHADADARIDALIAKLSAPPAAS